MLALIMIRISHNFSTKKEHHNNGTRKDSFVQPNVLPISAANPPQTVPAKKPTVRIDSSNCGAPFFIHYGTEQGLALTSVNCGIADSKGNLWFGTNGGGISRYDGKNFTNFTTAQGLVGNRILCIIQDKAENIWFGDESEFIIPLPVV